jgi:hypothetical protein
MLRDAWWQGERYERGQLVDPVIVRDVELMWAIFNHPVAR